MMTNRARGGQKAVGALRTTLSINKALAVRLRAIAERKALAPVEAIRVAIQLYIDSEERKGASAAVPDLLEATRALPNHYQEVVARWRLQRTVDQLRDVSSGRLRLEAHSAETYLLRIMADLHDGLGEGDSCSIATNTVFWRNALAEIRVGSLRAPEINRYLDAQAAAIARGMQLKRILLLPHGESKTEMERIVAIHQRFLKDCKHAYPDRADGVEVRFKEVGREDPLAQRPFAYVRRMSHAAGSGKTADECFIVQPRYDSEDKVTELGLHFSGAPNSDSRMLRDLYDRFQQAAEGSENIEDYGSSSRRSVGRAGRKE